MTASRHILRFYDENRIDEFYSKGLKRRYFFPHEIYYLPKCASEGFFFANRICNISDPNSLWEAILYAWGDMLDEFPEELFYDKDVIWHQEHFGKRGQIASANLVIDRDRLYSLDRISDIVQRIYLRKEYRGRVNSCFRYWNHMLLNSILNFAIEKDLKWIYSPSSDFLINNFYNGGIKPGVDRRLFDDIYDHDVIRHFDADQKEGMWVIDVNRNRHKLVAPETKHIDEDNNEKTICIFHDIEGRQDNTRAGSAPVAPYDEDAIATLKLILSIEKEAGVKTTYSVVGAILEDVREIIEKEDHCIAFHSYNHQISRQPVTDYIYEEPAILALLSKIAYKATYGVNLLRRLLSLPPAGYQPIAAIYRNIANKILMQLRLPPVINQFAECRKIDWRIKGYRHYQPKLGTQVNDRDLCYYNFEWIAIDDETPAAKPMLQNRVVKIPVFCGSQMVRHNASYDYWENNALEHIRQNSFLAIGLNDYCTEFWLPHYSQFLRQISSLGRLKTLDEISDQTFMAHAV